MSRKGFVRINGDRINGLLHPNIYHLYVGCNPFGCFRKLVDDHAWMFQEVSKWVITPMYTIYN